MTTDVIVITGTRPMPPYDPGPSGPGMHLHPDTDQGGGGGGDWGDPDPVPGEDPCQGQSEASSAHLPDDIQGVRAVAQTVAQQLVNLSTSGAFAEYGAFIVRDQNGGLSSTAPFTSNNSDNIIFGASGDGASVTMAVQVLRGIPPTSTIVAFVHTHRNDPRPSVNDTMLVGFLESNRDRFAFAASFDIKFLDYIVYTPHPARNIPGMPSLREFSQNEMSQISGDHEDPCGYRLN